jgi:tRNA pseudouridine55 synthase
LSSNHALQRVRRTLSAAKAGHAGTLDPMATGMLPLCFGQATKASGLLLGSSKAYRVRLRLGQATDTGDAHGKVIARAPLPPLDQADVEHVLAGFEGARDQIPPMYSALKRDGERLYRLARRGETVARAARSIELRGLRLLGVAAESIEFDLECSKGTYVRVLGEEIAVQLGSVGHLSELRRLWVAPFQADPMVSLDDIMTWQTSAPPDGSRPTWLLPVDRAFAGLPRLDLGPADSDSIRHGRPVQPAVTMPEGSTVRAYDTAGGLLGLLRAGPDGYARVVRLLVDGAS